uniref:Coproporphyrinogen oxidase n=1 Tax=Triticum urartu TaxID=4572 RepID=A0A8R7UVT3_TRIUA
MERETPEAAPPPTFLRGEEASSGPSSARARFERLIRRVQAEVCAALEAVEEGSGGGGVVFREDAWTRPGGGGGISRVLQGGRVFEKAAVNVSVVYGVMPPDAYRAARPDAAADAEKAGPVPFFAAGVSSVIHPNNPFAPTLHFNYRYFETEAPQDAPGAPRQWRFGGGTDLTPSYIIEEDIKHFHSVLLYTLRFKNKHAISLIQPSTQDSKNGAMNISVSSIVVNAVGWAEYSLMISVTMIKKLFLTSRQSVRPL